MAVIRLTKRLWREYDRQIREKAARQAAEDQLRRQREALIVEHMQLAADIARQVWRRFTRAGQGGYGSKIDIDDMIACAHVGLVQAAGRWDPTRGDFGKYCYLRVRGAIIDAYRRQAYAESLHTSIDEWLEDAESGARDDGGRRDLMARHLCDSKPLPDELANRGKLHALANRAIELLPDEERDVLREALGGAGVASIGEARGHSPAWARQKLSLARDKVAKAVRGRMAA